MAATITTAIATAATAALGAMWAGLLLRAAVFACVHPDGRCADGHDLSAHTAG